MKNDYDTFKKEINCYINEIKEEFNRNISNTQKIKLLMNKNNGYITTKEIDKNKIGRDYLKKMVASGDIIKVARGIYIDSNIHEDTFYTFHLKHPNVIFSHFTALYFHNMTEVYPSMYDITCVNNFYSSDFRNYNVFYVKENWLDIGLIMLEDNHGYKIKCYDLERCICDIIRSKDRLDFEQVKKSVKQYVKNKNKNIDNLLRYSSEMGIKDEVMNFVGMYYE